MPSDLTYHALIEACSQPGCPVCHLEGLAVHRYLDSLFFKSINDIDMRQHLRESLGFCREHAWKLVEGGPGDALGISIIYNDVITNLLRGLPDPNQPPKETGHMPSLFKRLPRQLADSLAATVYALAPHRRCPVCQQRELTVRHVITMLVDELYNEGLLQALGASDGLCLPHLRLAFERVKDLPTYTTLLTISRPKLERLQGELAEHVRKNDYRFRSEGFGHEADAWKRAIHLLVGKR